MAQEQKDLLVKDLCSRLPYGVIVKDRNGVHKLTAGNTEFTDLLYNGKCNIKPYLFPLSSITIEQEKELSKLGVSYGEYALHDDTRGLGIMVDEAYIFFEFCYKNHIDFLGLIEMGSAIDATGLNIY